MKISCSSSFIFCYPWIKTETIATIAWPFLYSLQGSSIQKKWEILSLNKLLGLRFLSICSSMIHWEPRCWRYCQACNTATAHGYQSVGGRDVFLQCVHKDTGEAEHRELWDAEEGRFMKSKMLLWPNEGDAPILATLKHCFWMFSKLFSFVLCIRTSTRHCMQESWGCGARTTESWHNVPSVNSLDSHVLSFLFWSQELLHRYPSRHPAVFGSPYWRSWTSDQRFHFNYRLE